MAELFDRLRIAKARVIRPGTDIVSELVAKGEIELGMVVCTENSDSEVVVMQSTDEGM
jgi:hypothetical protein